MWLPLLDSITTDCETLHTVHHQSHTVSRPSTYHRARRAVITSGGRRAVITSRGRRAIHPRCRAVSVHLRRRPVVSSLRRRAVIGSLSSSRSHRRVYVLWSFDEDVWISNAGNSR
ncbi:hypothetical protein DEO72_LG3g721 [Vigna unguiculata]|uniref:Uncharacterized protein n=1 Tax=Vigna unguiculata TaxID=3917 RepID=A0A4D6LCJ6_VIGUN|nr:hypothetical protein DEO72_LG3g721 [Vigna unguiculata]